MKTIKLSYIILCSICLFLASCSSDEEITKGGASEELVKKEKDYQRSIGKLIDIKLYRAEDKQKEFTGVLKAYDEKTVTLAFEKDEEKTFERANLAMIRLAFCD